MLLVFGSVQVNYALPVIKKMYQDFGASLPPISQLVVDLASELQGHFIAFWITVYFLGRLARSLGSGEIRWLPRLFSRPRRRIRRTVWWELSAARLCVAAHALVRAGKRPESFLPSLLKAEFASRQARAVFEWLPLDAASLETAAAPLVLDATRRARRWGAVIQLAGTALNLAAAFFLATAIYVAVSGLPNLVGQ
jgi:hypothetical protein